MKRYKKEAGGILEVGQILYTKHFKLTVDRERCTGCELCSLACPRSAISLISADTTVGSASAPLVDVDEDKCDFHGICAAICPFGAIKIKINGEETLPAVDKESFPVLERDIRINSGLCKPGCKKCEEICPLGIIKVSENGDGTVKVSETGGVTVVDVHKEQCAGCRICWMECPDNAIEVSKFIEGSITIETTACPAGCRNCVDICPVKALAQDDGGMVYAKDMYCIYCGACLQVCPADGALNVKRTSVRSTGKDSGAWHKALEKLTSAEGLARELAAKRTYKTQAEAEELSAKPGVNGE